MDQQQVRPDFVNYTFPAGVGVRILSSKSFTTNSSMLVGLEYKECIIILFYTQNEESIKLLKIWNTLASTVAGPIFATCNVLVEEPVGRAFAAVRSDGNHPLHVYGLHQWPVIIAYRGGFPQAVYNGLRSTQQIANWAMTMACNARYFEPVQIHAGINIDNQSEIVESPQPYIDKRVKGSSSYFDGSDEVRSYTKAEAQSTVQSPAESAESPVLPGATPVSVPPSM